MMQKLPTLARLLRQLQQVPYLASKNLYRVTHHFLQMDDEHLQAFCRTLQEAHEHLRKCDRCWSWQEKGQPCLFCDDTKRDHSIICVVETWYDLYAIERSGCYNGGYHVLGGAICPLDGIGPDDLTVDALADRVDGSHHEVILAMNQTPEGEATAAFIARRLEHKNVVISCLSTGVPVGGSLEYTDRLTVHKALSQRRPF